MTYAERFAQEFEQSKPADDKEIRAIYEGIDLEADWKAHAYRTSWFKELVGISFSDESYAVLKDGHVTPD